MPKDFSIRPSSPRTWCAPSPKSVLSSLLICSTGHLRWYALTTCRGIHSSRLVTRIFVCFGPRFPPSFTQHHRDITDVPQTQVCAIHPEGFTALHAREAG